MKITEKEKDHLRVILNDAVFQKAIEHVLTENRHRSTGEIEKNAMAHTFNEGMIQVIEKLNDLVELRRDITIKPRTLR